MPLTAKQIDDFRSVIANLDGVQTEITAAVKRKASEPVTSFQLKLINGVLAKANAILGGSKPVDDFEVFDPDDIPTAADVSMIVSQYVEALEKVRCGHIHKTYSGTWVWVDAPGIHTVPPRARK
jgi:hypothetical protein